MNRVAKWLVLGTVVALGACGDDNSPVPGDAGADVGTDAIVENCDNVTIAAETGASCGGVTPCDAGLECSRLDEAEEPICRQVCIPDTCESVCTGDEQCIPITDSPGTGVCGVPPTGEQGAYEPCSDTDGYCSSAYECLIGSAAATGGVCLPPCVEDGCPEIDGRGGQCVVRVSSPDGDLSFCAPACSAEGMNEECPADMECRASGSGFVCVFGTAG